MHKFKKTWRKTLKFFQPRKSLKCKWQFFQFQNLKTKILKWDRIFQIEILSLKAQILKLERWSWKLLKTISTECSSPNSLKNSEKFVHTPFVSIEKKLEGQKFRSLEKWQVKLKTHFWKSSKFFLVELSRSKNVKSDLKFSEL